MIKSHTSKLVGLLIILTSFSCSTENPVDPDTVTASAGADQTVKFGESVTFKGSGTSSTGGILTYNWEMVSFPAGSSLGGVSAASQDITFAPDVEGDYVLRLTATNEAGISNTDEASVTVEPANFVIIEADIDVPTVLKNLNEGIDYLVKGFLDVNAALEIEPGVRIHFDPGAGFRVQSDGSMNAVGTASDSIIFTGSTEVAGFWKGILFVDSDNNVNELTYCRVSYAGSNELSSQVGKANIGIGYFLNPSRVKIKNSLIRDADGRGISIDYRADGRFPEFADNKIGNNATMAMRINVITAGDLDSNTIFTNNGTDAVELYSSSIETLGIDAVWKSLSNQTPYHIEAHVYVAANLEIKPGATLAFGSDKVMRVDDNGSLLALGTSNEQITFTGITKSKGFWRGLYFKDSNNAINELTNVVFEYGGSSNLTSTIGKANLAIGYFLNPSKLKMTDVISRESDGKGFAVDYRSRAELTTFSNNTFSNNTDYGMQITPFELQYLDEATSYSTNNGNNDILVYMNGIANIDNNSTWVAPADGSKYIMDCDIIYNGDLVINPGVQFEFEANQWFRIDGSLSAVGNANQRISFSAVTKSAGAWKGVAFRDSNNLNNKLHYVDISYGGSDVFGLTKANLNLDQFASTFSVVDIQNSSFTNSGGFGLAISRDSSISTNTNNTFSGNAQADVFQEP